MLQPGSSGGLLSDSCFTGRSSAALGTIAGHSVLNTAAAL